MNFISLICMLLSIHVTRAETCASFHNFPNSCVDILGSGVNSNGYYQIAGLNGETWNVYCDFTSEPGSAWTLVMSWSFDNKEVPAFRSIPFTKNAPVNEQTPNWAVYRMSKEQMNFIKTKSTHWRATCSFDRTDFDYRDYVRVKLTDFDFTTFIGRGTCKKVEYINIRGHVGHQTVPFWQRETILLHTDSHHALCSFKGNAGSKVSEDNFGHYGNPNPAFRCTANPTATTQYWFGSYL